MGPSTRLRTGFSTRLRTGPSSVRPERSRRVGVGPSTRLRTGLPGAPILAFPQRGEGTFGLLHSFFVFSGGAPLPFALGGGVRLPIWVGLRASFDCAALRCAPFRFAQDELRGAALRVRGGLHLGCADGAPLPFALSCVEGLGDGPSTRLRTGLPGAPILAFPQRGGRDYLRLVLGLFVFSGGAPLPFALGGGVRLPIWVGLRASFDCAALRCAPFRFAQDERRGAGCSGCAGGAPHPFALSCVEGLGLALRRGSGQALRRGSGQALRRGSGQAYPGPHPNLPPAGGRDYLFGPLPGKGGGDFCFGSWFVCFSWNGLVGLHPVRPERSRRVGVWFVGWL